MAQNVYKFKLILYHLSGFGPYGSLHGVVAQFAKEMGECQFNIGP